MGHGKTRFLVSFSGDLLPKKKPMAHLSMGNSWEFHGDLMGYDWDLMGFNVDLIVI